MRARLHRTASALACLIGIRLSAANLPGHSLPSPSPHLTSVTAIAGGASKQAHEEIIPLAPPPKEGVDWDSFGFSLNGVETEAMFVAETDAVPADGLEPWTNGGNLQPNAPLAMHPAATVLNYGQGLFEGMKAVRRKDGAIVVFRPEMNARRMAAGARRLCLPPVPEKLFLQAVMEVVRANAAWVPPCGCGALYLRPLLFGSGAALGVGPSPQASFVVYASPVGTYFKKNKSPSGVVVDAAAHKGRLARAASSSSSSSEEDHDEGGSESTGSDSSAAAAFSPPPPIRLLVTPRFHRSVEGGVGGVKATGNYAPVFKASLEAKAAGFDEVLFLDGRSDRFVEEAGASNFFVVGSSEEDALASTLSNGKNSKHRPVLYTPGLGRGSILPGITRASLISLAIDAGYEVVEGDLPVRTVLEASEAFCCGTGATVTPVGSVHYKPGHDELETETVRSIEYRGVKEAGPITQQLASKMFGILAGTEPDPHGWVHVVMRGAN